MKNKKSGKRKLDVKEKEIELLPPLVRHSDEPTPKKVCNLNI